MIYWFVFCQGDLMLEKICHDTYTVPTGDKPPTATNDRTKIHTITPLEDGNEVRTYSIDSPDAVAYKYIMCGLRQTYNKLPHELYIKAGKCRELLYWDQHTNYCGVCGSPMNMHTNISKRCTRCDNEVWPQLATAVIVLIRKEDKVLLVRSHDFKGDFYGLVAGFVETGETLEQAVAREIKEETNLEVCDIEYFGSQPWPYPCGLMVGFNAKYKSGDIELQSSELSYCEWFDKDHLPTIPGKESMARMLIDNWIGGNIQKT